MGRENNQVEVSVNQRRGDGAVHPMDVMPPPGASPPRYRPVDEDKSFKKWFPWLVPTFVVANIVVFIVTMYVNNCPKKTGTCLARFLGRLSFQPFKENPLLGPSSMTLSDLGALQMNKIVHEHQGWRIIACIWLHGGVFHLLANMLGLLFIGIRLEQEFGFVKVGLLYVLSGIGGSLLSSLFVESGISVGASGALFGLLGGMLSELITNWTIYENKFAALTTLVVIIAANLAIGLLPRVDNFAHIGGFVSGFLLGFIFLMRPHFGWISQKTLPRAYRTGSGRRKHKMYQYIFWVVAAILLIIGFTIGFVLLFRGVDANEHCSWCHYLNCIPSSRWNCNDGSPVSCRVLTDDVQMTLTCSSSGKNGTYPASTSNSQLNSLCAQLCG